MQEIVTELSEFSKASLGTNSLAAKTSFRSTRAIDLTIPPCYEKDDG